MYKYVVQYVLLSFYVLLSYYPLCHKSLIRGDALGAVDEEREVFGHVAALDGRHAGALERVRELLERRVRVQAAAVLERARPRVDRRDRVGRCRPALQSEGEHLRSQARLQSEDSTLAENQKKFKRKVVKRA